jgi:hypothetical protein
LKPVEVTIRRARGRRENNGGGCETFRI